MVYNQTLIVGVGLNPHQNDESNHHIVADIVMIARSQGVRPVLYNLNRVSIEEGKLTTPHGKMPLPHGGMLLAGEVVSHNKEEKIIHLHDPHSPYKRTSVSYKHLIIASHMHGAHEGGDELAVGLQALAEALKIRKRISESLNYGSTMKDRLLLEELLQRSQKLESNSIEKFASDILNKKNKDGNPSLLTQEKVLFEVQL